MNYGVGDYVVYCSGEICHIESVVKRTFDGVNEIKYFKLIPINSQKSSYYIPCNNYTAKIRQILTKQEILSLIDDMPQTTAQWCDDRNERKNFFSSVLKSDDYHKLIGMMHSLYLQREYQREKGKKLLAADERAMNEAEHLLYQEFAFVLGIDYDKVEEFIASRINNKN